MIGVLLAACAAGGVHLLYSAVVTGERRVIVSGGDRAAWGPLAGWSRQTAAGVRAHLGLSEIRARDVAAMGAAAGMLGGLTGMMVFGAALPAAVLALCVSLWPLAALRLRRAETRAAAQEAWPLLIEEMRLRITSAGRSVPQALFEAGEGAPEGLRAAFEAAHREWLLSTDFERTVAVLKSRLADPTADAACETLLVAHEVGGTDLDRRLEALVEDRVADVQGRKDARSRQAGVRFARAFVLLVPCGMALVGMTIGSGRAAYATSWGQTMVVVGLLVVVVCWVWASRLLRLPAEQRVFAESGPP